MVLVSACLLGEHVRHDGSHAFCDSSILHELRDQGRLIPFCPEVSASLPIPRSPAEIIVGDGRDVIEGVARVRTMGGQDLTAQFLRGAENALEAAKRQGARLAILKDRSPSCGVIRIHDGSFSGTTRPGKGVTTTLLEENGIRVFSEAQVREAAECLRALELEMNAPTSGLAASAPDTPPTR